MNEELERRIGRNEALFRKINEAIARGLWPGEESDPVHFRCECARLDCNEVVTVTAEQYERVRAYPRRFLVRDGHQVPTVESVVQLGPGHLVVEKCGAAGVAAQEAAT